MMTINRWIATVAITAALGGLGDLATAQVRTKRPDRGTYKPEPTVFRLEPVSVANLEDVARNADSERGNQNIASKPDVQLASGVEAGSRDRNRATSNEARRASEPIDQVDYQSMIPVGTSVVQGTPKLIAPEQTDVHWDESSVEYHEYSAGLSGCDDWACDDDGCDSMGGILGSSRPIGLSFAPDQWFGSIEILLMIRSGDFFPVLASTGPDDDNADDTVLFGQERLFDDGTAGGRLTLGTWLDNSQCRSAVFRLWSATEDDFSFNADDNTVPVIGRPFFDVSDGITPTNEVNIVAAPGRANGAISINGTSDVYGADFSLRQFWYGRYGGTIDFLYGYQYMRLDESLSIGTTSQSLDGSFAPLGSVIAIDDSFDVENSFHGGQVGLASSYREGCWSFDMLAKVGFGSLRRQVDRNGTTTTSIGAATAVDPNGLLVRSTNAGRTTDHTFGWVPELDLTLGYRRFPAYDLTVGYHIIAMTDALQVSGAIDPNLATNLSDPPTGSQNPSPALRFDTFYVHGVHFGLRYSY